MTMKHIFPIFGLIFLLSSCIKNNPDPVWIEINEWTLEVNPNSVNSPGVLTENISDAWVYVDNELVGVFEVPCNIPVIYSGEKTIRIYPAILNNGISATKAIYPFLDDYVVVAELVENETITIDPVTRYKTNCKFWIDDFDAAGNKITDDAPGSDPNMINTTDALVLDPAINGNAFGRISLNSTDDSWVGYSVSTDVLELPKGQDVYLEIDYHNTNRMTTGLLAVSPSGTVDNPNIQLNPQDDSEVEWKKIYIELREIISASASGAYFQLSFQALLDEGDTEGEVNVDNIKVVYF